MAEKAKTNRVQYEQPDSGDSGKRKPSPGVSRQQRLAADGLMRLEKQLQSGVNISTQVLNQWVKRYGSDASDLISKYRGEVDNQSD